MSTYTYSDLLDTEKDEVRDQLGVTDISGGATTALISDEHIIAALSALGSVGAAVAYLARELAMRFAQKPTDVSLPSGLRVAWRERVSAWLSLAGDAGVIADAAASPAAGLLTTTAPVSSPCVAGPDANDRAYRGDPYRGRRWP